MSVRQIAEQAQVPHHRIAHYLKPGSNVTRLPTVDTMHLIATALGCDVAEVSRAFAADLGLPLDGEKLSPTELDLLYLWRHLDENVQQILLRTLRDLVELHEHK
jgi:transcriptional regulator with XRE-family HTH domain